MKKKSRMYDKAKTWNPFKGCDFNCIYCKPSFQLQAKRQKNNCDMCYQYTPHEHEERLNRIPSAEIIFVCGVGDISFCKPDFTFKIIESIKKHNERCPYKIYYFQSKRPEYFESFLNDFPQNVILLTTLETNRDDGYEKVSLAPPPSDRYRQFLKLKYPRKVLTIEPVMDLDIETFSEWINDLRPEYVWLGFNSRPHKIHLPEPSEEKLHRLINITRLTGIKVITKDMRGSKIIGV